MSEIRLPMVEKATSDVGPSALGARALRPTDPRPTVCRQRNLALASSRAGALRLRGPGRRYANVRKSGGAKNCRFRRAAGPSDSHVARSLRIVSAARTRKIFVGLAGTLSAHAGGDAPARAARSSVIDAAKASSTADMPIGRGSADQTNEVRCALCTSARARSASYPKRALTRSRSSMLGLPKVGERIASLQLSARDEVWLEHRPYLVVAAGEVR